jgi:hypothetical protein
MGMTRLRWGLGAALVLLSLVSAARALPAYVTRGLWLGSGTVILLAVIAVVGFASLLQARRRIERELAGLAAHPPAGELWTGRKAQLEAIRASGAAFDHDAVAALTEADERGRAYLGRYLVAVTVMVGLVGTFSGLMETLRSVGPLLGEQQVSTLRMLSGPLGGLDVTFGASLVGILITLALALVQGDLVLAEEQLLGRLEERTVHLLIPSLWPPSEATAERAARSLVAVENGLAALRGDLGKVLADASATVASSVAKVASAEVGRLIEHVSRSLAETVSATAGRFETTASQTTMSLERAGQAVAQTLREAAQVQLAALAASQKESSSALREVGDEVRASLVSLVENQAQAARAHAEALASGQHEVSLAMRAAVEGTRASLRESSDALVARLDGAINALRESVARTAENAAGAIAASADRAQTALGAVTSGTAEQLASAGGELARAAADLRAGAEALGPQLAPLAPELSALAREVALLAARDQAGDDGLVAEELVRIGASVDRLEGLLKLAQGEA